MTRCYTTSWDLTQRRTQGRRAQPHYSQVRRDGLGCGRCDLGARGSGQRDGSGIRAPRVAKSLGPLFERLTAASDNASAASTKGRPTTSDRRSRSPLRPRAQGELAAVEGGQLRIEDPPCSPARSRAGVVAPPFPTMFEHLVPSATISNPKAPGASSSEARQPARYSGGQRERHSRRVRQLCALRSGHSSSPRAWGCK